MVFYEAWSVFYAIYSVFEARTFSRASPLQDGYSYCVLDVQSHLVPTLGDNVEVQMSPLARQGSLVIWPGRWKRGLGP